MSAVVPQGESSALEVPVLHKPFALDYLIEVIAAALDENGHLPKVVGARQHEHHTLCAL
jgi:hypothetical protein